MMEDRFNWGFASGVISGIITNAWSQLMASLGFTTLPFAGWMAILIFGHEQPFSNGELLWALLSHIVFCGILGIFFVFLLLAINTRNLTFKAWIYSEFIWFFTYAVTSLFQVKGTMPLPLKTVISNFVASSLFGIALAQTLIRLGTRTSSAFRPVPSMKPLRNGQEEE